MTTMAMMVVIGVLVTTHFGFLRASGCNADFGPFVSYGIPWLAVLSPFVNGIAVIVYDRIFTRRSFSQSFETEEHSMNNLVNDMGNDMEQRMMTRYRKKISKMKAAKKAEGARYLSRKNLTPSLKNGFKVREFKPEFKKFRK
jgi:hypothetical protein